MGYNSLFTRYKYNVSENQDFHCPLFLGIRTQPKQLMLSIVFKQLYPKNAECQVLCFYQKIPNSEKFVPKNSDCRVVCTKNTECREIEGNRKNPEWIFYFHVSLLPPLPTTPFNFCYSFDNACNSFEQLASRRFNIKERELAHCVPWGNLSEDKVYILCFQAVRRFKQGACKTIFISKNL